MKQPYSLCARLVAGALTWWLALVGPAAQAQKVGSGTPTPTQTLDVNGSLRVRGLNGPDVRLTQVQPDGTLGTTSPLPAVTVLSSPPRFGLVPVSGVQGGTVAGSYLYVCNSMAGQVQVYTTASPSTFTTLSFVRAVFTASNQPAGVVVVGSTLYIANYGGPTIECFSLANPALPGEPGHYRGNGVAGFRALSGYLYAASYNAGPE